MPSLTNARHERFAQNLAKGMNATEAYEKAGYKPSEAHASRLAGKGKVKDRLAELQGSTAKQITDVRDLAREHTEEAVKTLTTVMKDTNAPQTARVAAANGILDRGHGKAVQYIEAEIGVYDSLGFNEKQALLVALEAFAGDEEGDSGGPAATHH